MKDCCSHDEQIKWLDGESEDMFLRHLSLSIMLHIVSLELKTVRVKDGRAFGHKSIERWLSTLWVRKSNQTNR